MLLATISTLCFLVFISDITPGPNFWKIVHYSVFETKKHALLFITGLSTSSAIHCLLGFFGVSALISQFEHALFILQILGGSYIAWYGFRLLINRRKSVRETSEQPSLPSQPKASKLWMDGVLTNFSNPKTILFYASLFAITLTPDKPTHEVFVILICLLLTSLMTNLLVANLFSLKPVRTLFRRWEVAINRVIGGLLILGGLKIALQSRG